MINSVGIAHQRHRGKLTFSGYGLVKNLDIPSFSKHSFTLDNDTSISINFIKALHLLYD